MLRSGGAKIDVADSPRTLGRRLRRMAVSMAFHSDGKPRGLVRRALFHSNGSVRGIFRRWVYRTRGTPRSVFIPWLASRNASNFRHSPEAPPDMNEDDLIVYARLRAARDHFTRDS